MTSDLKNKNTDLEITLGDLQSLYDQANTKGQVAALCISAAATNSEQIKEDLSKERKLHAHTKSQAAEYIGQVSLLRSQIETAERMAVSSANLSSRIRELEGVLQEMQHTLTDKEIALSEASKWQGNATDLRSQLKTLDDKLRDTDSKRLDALENIQNVSLECTGLQQSLAQKDCELAEHRSKYDAAANKAKTQMEEMKDKRLHDEERLKTLESSLEEQKLKVDSKADTIKTLMKEVERKTAETEMLGILKGVMQEQETTMAKQDNVLVDKELEIASIEKERDEMQDRYSNLMKTSVEYKQEVRQANKNHERWITERDAMKIVQTDMELKQCKTVTIIENLKAELTLSKTALIASKNVPPGPGPDMIDSMQTKLNQLQAQLKNEKEESEKFRAKSEELLQTKDSRIVELEVTNQQLLAESALIELKNEADVRCKEEEQSQRLLQVKRRNIEELERANRQLQIQLGLIGEDDSPGTFTSANTSVVSKTRRDGSLESPEPLDLKDQSSINVPGRPRNRMEMDVTPLQKKPTLRKAKTTGRKTKRPSVDMNEDVEDDVCSSARSTRSLKRRATHASRKDTDVNTPDDLISYEAPLSSRRGKRAALAKIGDLLNNSPIAKSAKKFVESHVNPSSDPDVLATEITHTAPPTTEKKRKKRLLKTDISAPFENVPFEIHVLNPEEPRGDHSHSIVTRKLRSRNIRA